jgi:exodeoxyribonuclease VII large subunit
MPRPAVSQVSEGRKQLSRSRIVLDTDEHVYTVSEITRQIRCALEERFALVWVEGEVSNFTAHTSGHLYFSLKDESAQLRCVMFRSRRRRMIGPLPANGVALRVLGEITVYERSGQYQLSVLELRPAGVGTLAQAFEELKRRLAEEGLFDAAHKRPIPAFPQRIGVVTSPTGAALRDIIHVIRRRYPVAHVVLAPVQVQGEGAAGEIAHAIGLFNRLGIADLLIVGRGGGSLEDLWAFNEEVVARAIFASRIPIISAVGHEIDYTIADFVADLRAPTPSAAAELAVPDRRELTDIVGRSGQRLRAAVAGELARGRERLATLVRSYGLRRPADLVAERMQRVDEFERRLRHAILGSVVLRRSTLESARRHLASLGPEAVLARGYSICRKLPEGRLVTRGEDLTQGDRVDLSFSRGGAECRVERARASNREF